MAAGVPRLLAAWLVLLGFVSVLAGAGWLIGRAVAGELDDLRESVAAGIDKVRDWLVNGPLSLGDGSLDDAADAAIAWLGDNNDTVTDGVVTAAAAASHAVAGVLLTLFVLFFFLADGRKVWRWVVRLLPRDSRVRVDEAGDKAWLTLTAYVRGVLVVALCDAVLIAMVLALVGVPLVLPLAGLTFLGAFVPVVGAVLAGSAAVLVALVDQGLTAALIVGGAVLVIQWVDSDVLQPVVVGRAVELHPLAIGLAVAVGSVLAGIGAAVVAVPLVAALNAAIVSLTRPSSMATHATEEDACSADPPAAERGRREDVNATRTSHQQQQRLEAQDVSSK